jgi:hypothetical protein
MNNLLRDQLLTNPKTFLRSIPFMKVSEGIAIGAVTGLGYFSAYLSDVSYKAYFGLPALYASVGLNAIILSIFAFVIMSLVLLAYLQYPIVARYGKWVLPVFLPGAVAFMLGLRLDFEFHYSVEVLLFFFLLYVAFTYALIRMVSKRKWFIAGLIFMVLVISISRACGYLIALNQKEYLVFMEEPRPYAVVDVNGEAMIMMPVDLKKKTLLPEYRFVDQKAELENSIPLKKMNIGPLRVQETRR